MADLKELTPWILGLLATAVAWLFKSHIQQGKDIIAMQTALKIYFEGTSKGAARVLDSPNPTPPEIRILLQKYRRKELSDEERNQLKEWLRNLKNAPDADKSERSAAIQLLASMEAIKALSHGHG